MTSHPLQQKMQEIKIFACVHLDGPGEEKMEVQDGGAPDPTDRRKDQCSSQVDYYYRTITNVA